MLGLQVDTAWQRELPSPMKGTGLGRKAVTAVKCKLRIPLCGGGVEKVRGKPKPWNLWEGNISELFIRKGLAAE